MTNNKSVENYRKKYQGLAQDLLNAMVTLLSKCPDKKKKIFKLTIQWGSTAGFKIYGIRMLRKGKVEVLTGEEFYLSWQMIDLCQIEFSDSCSRVDILLQLHRILCVGVPELKNWVEIIPGMPDK